MWLTDGDGGRLSLVELMIENLRFDGNLIFLIPNMHFSNEDDPLASSTFRRSQRKMASQIEKLERESVAKKSWTLLGEASSKQRSQNSLLENFVEYESNAKVIICTSFHVACIGGYSRSHRFD